MNLPFVCPPINEVSHARIGLETRLCGFENYTSPAVRCVRLHLIAVLFVPTSVPFIIMPELHGRFVQTFDRRFTNGDFRISVGNQIKRCKIARYFLLVPFL